MSAVLTPAQFAEARAYCRERDGSVSLRHACHLLGFPLPPSLETLAQPNATRAVVDGGPPLAQGSAGSQPSAGHTPPAALTRQEQADRAKAHAKANNVSFLAAFKALGFDRSAAAAPARAAAVEPPAWARPIARRSELAATAEQRAAMHQVKQLQVAAAKTHARKTGLSFVGAFKALGLAA